MEPPLRLSIRKSEALERIVKLYDTWKVAEPGKGYDAQAAEWRTKVPKEPKPGNP